MSSPQGLSSWFRGIKGRLLFTAFIPIIGFVILFVVSIVTLNRYDAMLDIYSDSIVPNLHAVGEMRQARNKFAYQALASIDAENAEDRKKRLASAVEGMNEFKDAYKAYTAAPFLPGEAEIHDKAKGSIPEFYNSMSMIVAFIENGDAAQIKEARTLLYGPYAKVGSIIRQFNVDVSKMYEDVSEKQEVESNALRERASVFLVITAPPLD